MYKPLLLLTLGLSLASHTRAQSRTVPVPGFAADSLNRITFTEVVTAPGVSAAELQARAREWVALTFQDAQQVTQLDDAARGVLILRGFTNLWQDINGIGTGGTASPLAFTLRLDFRDGRYRYELNRLGLALRPYDSSNSSVYGAPRVAAQQGYDIAAWQLGATGTVAASPRQALLQPDYSPDPADYNLSVALGKRWPKFSASLKSSVSQLLESLRQHETRAPAKW